MTTGLVVGVHANLPARYFDVVVSEGEVTERDENGAAVGWQWNLVHPRGETPFGVPVEPPIYEETEEPRRTRGDGVEEWTVMFWHADNVETALVLKAPDVVAAAQRVKDEFPLCGIVSIEQAEPEEHPMTYLDENEIILPIGGPRVQTERITKQ
jgi:hypothetical protein